MDALRGFIIGLANVIIVATIILGTIGGFLSGGAMGWGFSVFRALIGAAVGFFLSAAAMSVLAILLDIRAILARIEAKGGRV
jgi:hypothetical protein